MGPWTVPAISLAQPRDRHNSSCGVPITQRQPLFAVSAQTVTGPLKGITRIVSIPVSIKAIIIMCRGHAMWPRYGAPESSYKIIAQKYGVKAEKSYRHLEQSPAQTINCPIRQSTTAIVHSVRNRPAAGRRAGNALAKCCMGIGIVRVEKGKCCCFHTRREAKFVSRAALENRESDCIGYCPDPVFALPAYDILHV